MGRKALTCELLIVGAGPAGMAAALAAAESGRRVALLDDNPSAGGQIWRDGPQALLPEIARQYRDMLRRSSAITHLRGAKSIAVLEEKRVLYEQEDASGVIQYQRLVLCCGARELLLPFPGWTLPGVTGAGGLQALIKGGVSLKKERVVIAGSGPLLPVVAQSVKKAGGQVVYIAEQAGAAQLGRFLAGMWRWPGKGLQSLSLFDRHYRPGSWVVSVQGESQIRQVTITQGERTITLDCERLACGFGLIANIELALALGCDISRQAIRVDEWQQTSRADIYAAGECTGIGGSEQALVEGKIAGYAASDNQEQAQRLWPARRRWQRFARALDEAFQLDARLKHLPRSQTLLCRCEDVPLGLVTQAADWRQAKIYSRCGMGACQGKVCGAAARFLLDWPLAAPRPPFAPARVETLIAAGEASPTAEGD